MMVGFSGLAGVGKDTAADLLVREKGFVKIAFADPMKRICADVFEFTDDQLWGPSESRNAPDKRYLRGKHLDQDQYINQYLTPRYALQQLGTEWARDCYEPIWVEYGLRVARRVLAWNEKGAADGYDPRVGLKPAWKPAPGVVFSDVRFQNEVERLRGAGAKIVRIVRQVPGLKGEAALHESEKGQSEIPDHWFDAVIRNDGSFEDFYERIRSVVLG